jgi:hypothetical protein
VCNLPATNGFLVVGQTVAGKPVTVLDGDSSRGSPVNVACTVAPAGGGFDVSLNVTVGGAGGSSLTITTQPGQGAVTLQGASGVTAVFKNASAAYRETDCTIAFTYVGGPVPDTLPVAAGRIWGHVSCPAAQNDQQAMGPDGGLLDLHCDAEADFLFEQCGQ